MVRLIAHRKPAFHLLAGGIRYADSTWSCKTTTTQTSGPTRSGPAQHRPSTGRRDRLHADAYRREMTSRFATWNDIVGLPRAS
jgi:hypothetical protein